MKVFKHLGVTPCVTMNAKICETYPQVVAIPWICTDVIERSAHQKQRTGKSTRVGRWRRGE